MPRILAVVLLLSIAGCGRPREYTALAPAGALECALREARELGYRPAEGEREAGYVRVTQRVDPLLPPRVQEGAPRPGPEVVPKPPREVPMYNELMLREDGERLRIRVVEPVEGMDRTSGNSAESHAEIILAACSAP